MPTEQKVRIDKFTNEMTFIRKLIFDHECGEIYITWKGGKMTVKFSQMFHLPNVETDLTNQKDQE